MKKNNLDLRYLLNRPRCLAARCSIICIVAHAGGALAHNVAPDFVWQYPGAGQLVPAALGDRWMFATNVPRRATAPEKSSVSGSITRPAAARPSSRQAGARVARDVVTATAAGPAQSGYLHYFVIESPDGERETQVGIGLPDGRIAWSFPGLGVVVSPFMESGVLQAGARSYAVQHRYGIRPFHDDSAMLALQRNLWSRVIPWVEDETPHCNFAAPGNQPCLSCLDFVLRVLYPPRSGGMPSLPADFERSGADLNFTTEDLLLYQAGLHGSRSPAERMARIDALALPPNLRSDLIDIAQLIASVDDVAAAAAPGKFTARKRPPGRSLSKARQSRASSVKRL